MAVLRDHLRPHRAGRDDDPAIYSRIVATRFEMLVAWHWLSRSPARRYSAPSAPRRWTRSTGVTAGGWAASPSRARSPSSAPSRLLIPPRGPEGNPPEKARPATTIARSGEARCSGSCCGCPALQPVPLGDDLSARRRARRLGGMEEPSPAYLDLRRRRDRRAGSSAVSRSTGFPAHFVAAIAMGLPGLGCFLIASSWDSFAVLVVAVCCLGAAWGAEGDVIAYLVSRRFGLTIYSTVLSMLWPPSASPPRSARRSSAARCGEPQLQRISDFRRERGAPRWRRVPSARPPADTADRPAGPRFFTRCRRTVVTVAARCVRSRPSTSRR